MRLVVGIVVFLLAAGWAAADKLTLKDGQVVTGEIVSITNSDVRIKTAKETMRVPRWAIEKVERTFSDGRTETVDLDTPESRPAPPEQAPVGARLPARRVPEATPELMAWVDVCVEHLGSRDEGVRTGAASALRTAGPAAKPALEKASGDADKLKAQLAKRILGQITRYESRLAEQTGSRTPRGVPHVRHLEAIGSELGLSPAQHAKFKAVIDDYYAKQEQLSNAIRARKVDVGEAGSQASELRKDCDRKLAEVLTVDQMERYNELAARRGGPANR